MQTTNEHYVQKSIDIAVLSHTMRFDILHRLNLIYCKLILWELILFLEHFKFSDLYIFNLTLHGVNPTSCKIIIFSKLISCGLNPVCAKHGFNRRSYSSLNDIYFILKNTRSVKLFIWVCFYRSVSGRFPISCVTECKCYSNRHHGASVADCSHSGLTHIPDSLPEETDWLLLSGNNFSSLITTNEEINDTLYHLSQLDLRGNNLTNISSEVMDGFIETNALLYFDLSNNKLSDLPENIRNLTSVKTLKISGNKFKCSCKSFWMKEWLLSETQVVEDFENIACEMKSGKRIPIVHMDKTDMGCVPTTGEPLSAWEIAGKYLFGQILNVEFLLNETTLTGPFYKC